MASSKRLRVGCCFLVLSAMAAVAVTSPTSLVAQASNPQPQQQQPQQPSLLTLEQQQDLLQQLAQLQRQTQQLLAAQQSLAAVAAAAAANTPGSPQAQPQAQQQQQFRQVTSAAGSQPPPQQQQPAQPLHHIHSTPRGHHQPATKPAKQQQSAVPSAEANQSGGGSPPLPQGPQINWGKCPELEPSEQEKLAKANVITKCLETTPLPGNITRESVEQHREQIAACALRAEGWFTPDGGYDFAKAEKEIKNKHLQEDLENQVLSYHTQCKIESEEKYPATNSSIIAQIQLYQACMDYFISDVCGIEVNEPDAPQFRRRRRR